MNPATRRWRIVFLIGVFATVLGAGLVAQGEIRRARDDERYRDAQAALKAGVEVFSDDVTLSDDLTQDPKFGTQTSSTDSDGASGSPSSGGAAIASIGRLQIPKIDIDVATVKYGRYADLEIGIGWMPQSAALGEKGASIIVGHRSLFGGPFRDLDQLVTGDPLKLVLPDGKSFDYQVVKTLIRRPSESFSDLLEGSESSRLVLVTCHPANSTDFRLIVVADVAVKA